MSLMTPQDKWSAEDIGIYSSVPVAPLLQSLAQDCFYNLEAHSDLQSFHYWILSRRPQLVIIQAKLLSTASHEDLQSLRNTLNTWGIMSLLLAETVDEIHYWRSRLWPRLHFHLGGLKEQSLKKRVMTLVNERLLLDEPSVLILSRRPYLIAHFEGVLRQYGIRLTVYPNAEEDFSSVLALDHPEAMLCDVQLDQAKKLIATLKESKIYPFPLSIFWIGEEKGEKNLKKPREIHIPTDDQKLLKTLLDSIYERRQRRLTCCRDVRTGLHLKEAFLEVAEREMAIVSRRREEFSILKLKLFSMHSLEKKYGSIFVSFLNSSIGDFIRNHVRASDFVAQGNGGEILVLFPRVGRPVATLIGERLCHQFSKEASFRETPETLFQPSLGYEVFSYPHNFLSLEELRALLNQTQLEEKGGWNPLASGLVTP